MLIGLSGKAGSGKDTACGFIEEYFRQTRMVVQHKSFAHKLKQSALAALGIKTDDPLGVCDALKSHGQITVNFGDGEFFPLSGRTFLQNYGTEAHRDIFGTDFWVDVVLPPDADHVGEVWVITDVRFPNEAQRVRDLGGYVVEITRPGSGAGTHASETPLPRDLVDKTIDNRRGLDSFRVAVTALMNDILNHALGLVDDPKREELAVSG